MRRLRRGLRHAADLYGKQPEQGDEMKIVTVVTLAVLMAGCSEADMQAHEAREYCEMTAIWKADAALGAAPKNRRGWPDFNMNADDICGGSEDEGI